VTQDEKNSIEVIANNVKWIKESFEKFEKSNTLDHESILKQQKITNGTVRDLKNEVFAPDCPDDGLVNKSNKYYDRITKLEKSYFRLKVIYTPLIIITTAALTQWMEEVFRGTVLDFNAIMKNIMSTFGG
jgi:hypothetical protein